MVAAGHSVGELAAAALAGVLGAEAAGRAGPAARPGDGRGLRPLADTGMTAVLGGDPEAVFAGLDELGLTAANRNGAGQVVAAGSAEQLAELTAQPPGGAPGACR